MDFSLIIPTFNERQNIVPLLERLRPIVAPFSFEIIVVDDASPDGTAAAVRNFMTTHPWVKLIERQRDRGLSSAVLRGFEAATGDMLGVMDADGSHDETILPMLLRAVGDGAELAIGSRRVPGGGADHWPWYRRLMSNVATSLTKWVLRVSMADPMSGYFVLRRVLYERSRYLLAAEGYKILLEFYCHGNPTKVVEIPFIFKDRRQGQSKLTLRVMLQLLKSLWRLHSVGPSAGDNRPFNPL